MRRSNTPSDLAPSSTTGRLLALAAMSAATSVVLGMGSSSALAQYAVTGQFQSQVVTLPVSPQGGFTVHEGTLHSWNTGLAWPAGNYSTYHFASGTRDNISDVELDGNGFGDPFGIYEPVSGTFYAGTYSGSGTGLWRRNSNNAWTKLGVFDSLYGADTHAGNIYASGLNTIWNGSSGQDNVIALYDLTGGSQHDVLIQATGNSASVAVDNQGNVYYANYGNLNGTASGLRVWTAEQINSVRADLGNGQAGGGQFDSYLTYADGALLCTLPGGANGITVDDAGNVFVSFNGSSSGILMWNAALGVGNSQSVASLSGWGWAGMLDADGDVLNGGTLYAADFGSEMTLITYVPEPAALSLLGLGCLALRRRQRTASV